MLRPLSQTEQLSRGRYHGMCWEDNGQQERPQPTISPPHPHAVSMATRGLCTSDVKNHCSARGRCPRPLSQGNRVPFPWSQPLEGTGTHSPSIGRCHAWGQGQTQPEEVRVTFVPQVLLPMARWGTPRLEATCMVRQKSGQRSALCISTERCSEDKSYESNTPPLNY